MILKKIDSNCRVLIATLCYKIMQVMHHKGMRPELRITFGGLAKVAARDKLTKRLERVKEEFPPILPNRCYVQYAFCYPKIFAQIERLALKFLMLLSSISSNCLRRFEFVITRILSIWE